MKSCLIENRLKSRDIIAEIGDLISAILVEDNDSYLSPSKMILERKKECGILI